MKQTELFRDVVESAFSENQELSTSDLYDRVRSCPDVDLCAFDSRAPIGRSSVRRSKAARAVRWVQQTLKAEGLIQRVPGQHGRWRVTNEGKLKLSRLPRGCALLAFSTKAGVAVWGDCRDAVNGLKENIHLLLTSPPYPLACARAYGGPDEAIYVDWLCGILDPFVSRLAPGGNIAINISNDIFKPGGPSRSLYRERLLIALHDRFGLEKMDELIWRNPSKPPSPVQWASKTRQQLNCEYEPILWLTNDPTACRSDNRRVLEPHSARQQRLIDRGGSTRDAAYSDGSYRLRPGAFSNPTPGRIPRNVLTFGHSCKSQRRYKKEAAARGFPVHGAPMPLALARWLIRFLSRPGDLVADPMAGSLTTGEAAELEGRRWLCMEQYGEYLGGSQVRFEPHNVLEWVHPSLKGSRIPGVIES